jgi:hypothetical protein
VGIGREVGDDRADDGSADVVGAAGETDRAGSANRSVEVATGGTPGLPQAGTRRVREIAVTQNERERIVTLPGPLLPLGFAALR